jgi:hypothetical protein
VRLPGMAANWGAKDRHGGFYWEGHSPGRTSRWRSRLRGFRPDFAKQAPRHFSHSMGDMRLILRGRATSAAPLVGLLSEADLLSASVRRDGRSRSMQCDSQTTSRPHYDSLARVL